MTESDQKEVDIRVEHSERTSEIVSSLLRKQWDSDCRAKIIEWCGWGMIGIVMITLFSIQIYRYTEREFNVATRTDIKIKVNEIDIPYFYFSTIPDSTISNVNVEGIYSITDDPGNESIPFSFTAMNFTGSDTFVIPDELYGNEWIAVDISHKNTTQYYLGDLLIIPPEHLKMKNREGLLISLMSKSDIAISNVAHAGFGSGLFWSVGNVGDISKNKDDFESVIAAGFASYSKKRQLQYSSMATTAISWLNVVEEIDKFKNPKNPDISTYYTPQKISEVFDQESVNGTSYTNWFYFYLNPTGFGIKTQVTTEKDTTLLTTIGNVGGFLGPIAAFTSIFVTFLIFGFPPCFKGPCFKFKGFASEKGLSEKEKRQIALYLLELRLIDEKQYEKMDK